MSACNFPTFAFAIPFPFALPGKPDLPDLSFTLAFSLPCPLD